MKINTGIPYICDNCNDNQVYGEKSAEASNQIIDLNETNVVESCSQSNLANSLCSSAGTTTEIINNENNELCNRANTVLTSQLQKLPHLNVSSETNTDSVILMEDSSLNVVVSQPTEPKQVQTDKDSHSVSEMKVHPHSDSKEKTINNQKRSEKQSTSSNIYGKNNQVVEQQKINLDQLKYIYKLEARVKNLNKQCLCHKGKKE